MSFKVLIVDDSKLARMSVAKALATVRPGWTKLEAVNADEALAMVRREGADIALLDFNMPGRDGLTLASELREIDADMPLAVVSANHQDEVVARARAVGAAFLAKPITEQSLRDFLDHAARRLTAK